MKNELLKEQERLKTIIKEAKFEIDRLSFNKANFLEALEYYTEIIKNAGNGLKIIENNLNEIAELEKEALNWKEQEEIKNETLTLVNKALQFYYPDLKFSKKERYELALASTEAMFQHVFQHKLKNTEHKGESKRSEGIVREINSEEFNKLLLMILK